MDASIKFQMDKLGWWCSVCEFGASFETVLEAQMMAEMHKHWRTDRTDGGSDECHDRRPRTHRHDHNDR